MDPGIIGDINLIPGEIIRGNRESYLLLGELGEGGFGTVWKAKGNTRNVALKIVKMWKVMPHDRILYATKIRQEFEISTKISSPYVIKGYDFHYHEGNPFIVMELCEGGTMRRTMTNPSIEFGKRVALDILKGLSSLHQDGIIHRDIKPENILLDLKDRAKLVDFGISASIKKRHTKPNILGFVKEVFATITYSPPEQTDEKAAFKSVGPTNDIYSFGVTMYEYFTGGTLPFGSFDDFSDDFVSYNKRKRSNGWDRKSLERSIAPKQWHTIIEKCLQPEAQKRYSTTDEIINLLDPSHVNNTRSTAIDVNPDQQWVLRIMQGDQIGREYNLSVIGRVLKKNELTIGWFNVEDPFVNDVGLVENLTKYISTFHATLKLNKFENLWSITDGQQRQRQGKDQWLLSTNGVLVNSEKVGKDEYQLLPDDIITLGDTTLKVILK